MPPSEMFSNKVIGASRLNFEFHLSSSANEVPRKSFSLMNVKGSKGDCYLSMHLWKNMLLILLGLLVVENNL